MLHAEETLLRLTCPGCGNGSDVPDHLLPPAGSRGRCNSCHRKYHFDGRALIDDDPTPANPLDALGDDDEVTPRPTGPGQTPPPLPVLVTAGAERAAAGRAGKDAHPPATPKPLPDGWLIMVSLNPAGPFTGMDVKARIRNNQLAETQAVMVPGTQDWVPAGDVPELQRFFAIRRAASAPKISAKDAATALHCTKHPTLRAEWGCAKCGTNLCNACTVLKDMNRLTKVKTCGTCGSACHPVKYEAPVIPFWEDIPNLLKYPVRNGGWIAIIFCSLTGLAQSVAGAAGLAGLGAVVILGTCLLAYHLFILRSSAHGDTEVPNIGNVEDIVAEMVIPGFKGIFVTAVVTLPLMIYGCTAVAPAARDVAVATGAAEAEAAFAEAAEEIAKKEAEADPNYDPQGKQEAMEAFQDHAAQQQEQMEEQFEEWAEEWSEETPAEEGEPGWTPPEGLLEEEEIDREAHAAAAKSKLVGHVFVFFLLCLYAIVTLPILLIIVALYNTVVPAFSPVTIARVLGVIKKEYGIGLLFLFVLFLLSIAVQVPFQMIPTIGPVLGGLLMYYFSFLAFHVMGRIAQLAQAKLGW